MRTPYRGLRMACDFLDAVTPQDVGSGVEYEKRRNALQRLNITLNVRTVLDGCNAGHEQKYIDLIEGWKD